MRNDRTLAYLTIQFDGEDLVLKGKADPKAIRNAIRVFLGVDIPESPEPAPAAARPDMTAVLEAIAAAWDDYAPWSKTSRGGERHSIRRLVIDFGMRARDAEQLLARLAHEGRIEYALRDRGTKLMGYRVTGQGAAGAFVFD